MRIGDPITSKARNIHAFRHGYYGNTLEVWDTLEEFLQSDEPTATLRCRDSRGGGGFCRYLVPRDEVAGAVQELLDEGAAPGDIWMHANPPGDGQILQFEYQHRDDTGWITEPVMHYSYLNEPMRPALAKTGQHCKGHTLCNALIRKYMTDASWEAFKEVREMYPGHVLEVSCFNTMVGVVPGHNSLIWEVRKF